MKVLEEVKKLDLGESQNQRDRRVEELWNKLDPHGNGELDVKGLQKGLHRIDHRQLDLNTALSMEQLLIWDYSLEECRRHDAGDCQDGGCQP